MSAGKLEGGALGGADDLYREVILDHFKAPKNKGRIENPNAKADGMNPLCGDQISMTGTVSDGRLTDVKFEGHGCAISQSAASMLTQLVKGRSLTEIREIAQTYKFLFGVEGAKPGDIETLGDAVALEGVKKYPVRIKCALLSCNTLLQSIDDFDKTAGAR